MTSSVPVPAAYPRPNLRGLMPAFRASEKTAQGEEHTIGWADPVLLHPHDNAFFADRREQPFVAAAWALHPDICPVADAVVNALESLRTHHNIIGTSTHSAPVRRLWITGIATG